MSDKKKRRDDVELEEKKSSKPPAARAKSKEPKSDMERAVEAAKAKKAMKQARGDTGDSDPDDLFGSDDEDKMPKRATRQVTSKPDVSRDWLVTLFDLPGAVDAEGDAETCCISCCCPCIGVAQAQTYIKDEGDEACLQAGVLYCFMSPLWCCWCGLVRGAYRETVGIEGNGCFDCLAGCFLPCCASAQMIRDYHAARQQGKLPSKKKKKSVGRVRSKEQVPREEEKRPSRKPQTDRSERPREAGAKAPLSARDEKRPRPAATTAAAASAGSEHSVSSNRSEERKKYRQEKGADSLSPPQRVKSREGGDADRRPSSSQGSGSSAPKKPAAERKSSQTKADDDSTPAARSKSRERDDAGPQRASTKKSSDSSAAPRSKSREPDDSGPARVQSKKASSSDKRKS